MQLSLLAIGKSLNMMNPHDWSFGQIVAITVWAPPILEYLYGEFGTSMIWRDEAIYLATVRWLLTLVSQRPGGKGGGTAVVVTKMRNDQDGC